MNERDVNNWKDEFMNYTNRYSEYNIISMEIENPVRIETENMTIVPYMYIRVEYNNKIEIDKRIVSFPIRIDSWSTFISLTIDSIQHIISFYHKNKKESDTQ